MHLNVQSERTTLTAALHSGDRGVIQGGRGAKEGFHGWLQKRLLGVEQAVGR